ncbi:MAG: hypothetical protein MI740_19195 [Halanaerobiales bacterium]|nr:hypothetical protein [Halanaerobiales bacterium]
MNSRKLRCSICGSYNWSSKEYCDKCSGSLYRESLYEESLLNGLRFWNFIG